MVKGNAAFNQRRQNWAKAMRRKIERRPRKTERSRHPSRKRVPDAIARGVTYHIPAAEYHARLEQLQAQITTLTEQNAELEHGNELLSVLQDHLTRQHIRWRGQKDELERRNETLLTERNAALEEKKAALEEKKELKMTLQADNEQLIADNDELRRKVERSEKAQFQLGVAKASLKAVIHSEQQSKLSLQEQLAQNEKENKRILASERCLAEKLAQAYRFGQMMYFGHQEYGMYVCQTDYGLARYDWRGGAAYSKQKMGAWLANLQFDVRKRAGSEVWTGIRQRAEDLEKEGVFGVVGVFDDQSTITWKRRHDDVGAVDAAGGYVYTEEDADDMTAPPTYSET